MTAQLWRHCRVATLQPAHPAPYGLINGAALVLERGRIAWVGLRRELPADLAARCTREHDAGGALITPGLIDCHTHLVYGGDRAHEFELRLQGASYEDVARAGGGISSTVKATRAATEAELQAQSLKRLRALIAEGRTTLEIESGAGTEAMSQAGSVAVLLPGAFYFLRETKLPPVALLREHGVPMAISTDCNPGSSPCTSLLLMLNLACTLFCLTPEEALTGVTRHAARALGLSDRGVLAPGLRADFVVWDVAHPAQLAYALGANPRLQTVFEGELV